MLIYNYPINLQRAAIFFLTHYYCTLYCSKRTTSIPLDNGPPFVRYRYFSVRKICLKGVNGGGGIRDEVMQLSVPASLMTACCTCYTWTFFSCKRPVPTHLIPKILVQFLLLGVPCPAGPSESLIIRNETRNSKILFIMLGY